MWRWEKVNVLYHTIPHKLFECDVNDVHRLHSFVFIHSEESCSVLSMLCLQLQMLLTAAFSKQNPASCLEEWVLVLRLFTRMLRVNAQPTGTAISRRYTLQSLLIIKNKTWLVKKIWFLIQKNGKVWKIFFKKSLYGYHTNKTPKTRCTTVLSQFVK